MNSGVQGVTNHWITKMATPKRQIYLHRYAQPCNRWALYPVLIGAFCFMCCQVRNSNSKTTSQSLTSSLEGLETCLITFHYKKINRVSNMNRVMLMIFSLLTLGKAATIQEIGSYSHNGRMMGPQNSEAGVMVNHLQNKMAADAMYGTKGEDCGAKDNRLSDGIYVPQADPVTEHLERIQKQQQCLIAKAKTQKAIEDTMKRVVKETTKQAANDFQKNLEKKNCVNKLDRANHECFVKDVLKDFYTAVVWKVAVHDNVAQLWYHDKLVLMLVFETIDYNVKPEEQECFTFFPTSNVAAEENALGHVVNVIGKPATPKSATQGECRPCTDFLKKTVEGTASKCTNNCDPSNILFSGSNFKTKKGSTSTVAPTEARNKGGKED